LNPSFRDPLKTLPSQSLWDRIGEDELFLSFSCVQGGDFFGNVADGDELEPRGPPGLTGPSLADIPSGEEGQLRKREHFVSVCFFLFNVKWLTKLSLSSL